MHLYNLYDDIVMLARNDQGLMRVEIENQLTLNHMKRAIDISKFRGHISAKASIRTCQERW